MQLSNALWELHTLSLLDTLALLAILEGTITTMAIDSKLTEVEATPGQLL